MAFIINGVTYSHADATMVLTPLEGQNAGIPLELKSVKSFEGDLAASSEHMQGMSISPDAIVPTGAKPTWSAELSNVGQSIEIALFLGAGAVTIPCMIEWTYQRPGLPSHKLSIPSTLITKGLGGFKSGAGSAPMGTIGGNATNILTDDVDLLNRPAA